MSSLMQYNVNTGALVPVRGALNNPDNSLQTESPPLSLTSSVPSSQLSGWLTSGYLGDFLGWVGEQLADLGSDLFPAPSVVERKEMMHDSERHLKQLLTDKMLNENVNEGEFSQTLNSYFHHGLVLIKAGDLGAEKWKAELIELRRFSKEGRDEATQNLLSEWIDQLTSLLEKEKAKLQIPESQKVDEASVATLEDVGNGAQLGDADGGKKTIPQRYPFFASKSTVQSQTPEPPSKSSIIGICPSGADVKYDNDSGQYKAKGGWYQSYPQPGAATPNATIIAFDSANIMGDPEGEAACLYGLNAGPPFFNALGELILKDKTYQNATGIGENWIVNGSSQFWPPAEPKPASTCIAVPENCPFEEVEPSNAPVRTILKR